MWICIVNPVHDVAKRSPEPRYHHVDALAEALARRGHGVSVVQAFNEDRIETHGSVEFRFVQTPAWPIVRLTGGRLGTDLLVRGNADPLVRAIDDLKPDVVHMNGLTLLRPLSHLGEWCSRTRTPLTASYHGGRPRRAPWLRPVQRQIYARCHSTFFTTRSHAEPWLSARLLRDRQVVTCTEVSSTFAPADRAQARARTDMHGYPVFLWNARLHPLKDPMTALKGFSAIRSRWPGARLYMIYLTNELEPDIRRTISSDPGLDGAVELRGRVPHQDVADLLNSADFLIQGSLSEVSSYSVAEAMSCGVIPVLSDIPSFRAMTDDGRCGILFPIGDHRSLADRVLRTDPNSIDRLSLTVRESFVQNLSYERIAATYEATFLAALERPASCA